MPAVKITNTKAVHAKIKRTMAAMAVISAILVMCGCSGAGQKAAAEPGKQPADITAQAARSKLPYDSEAVTIDISNNCGLEVVLGRRFELDRLEDGKWMVVPFKDAEALFPDDAVLIMPGDSYGFTARLDRFDSLEKGKYRVVIEAAGGRLAAEFELI